MRSYGCYNLEDVKEKLAEEINADTEKLNAWKNVTYKTTAKGHPFKNLAKNFDGAYITDDRFTGNPELFVSGKNDNGKYFSDSIALYEWQRYMTDEDKKMKVENFKPDGMYHYDLADTKKEIAQHIRFLEKSIEEEKEELKNADKAYNEFNRAIVSAMENLKKSAGDDENYLFHVVRDTVLENNRTVVA